MVYFISMQKIVLKTSSLEVARSIKEYFLQTDIKIIAESLNKEPLIADNFDFCILAIDFENQSELEKAKKLIGLNKHLNFCAYVNDGTKDGIINAHRLGCTKFISKLEDLKDIVPQKQEISIQYQSRNNKLYSEFAGLKVLLVDDVEVNLKLLTEILKPFHFELFQYTDSSLAAEAIEQIKFDLILTDAIMPKVNGFELAKLAKNSELNQSTPLAFISGYSQAENKIESYNLGSAAFIEKPLEPATVRAQIYSIVKINALQTEIIKEKENFIAMLTHDLKTPIRAQISALSLLIEGKFGDMPYAQKELANEIMASNKFMQNMTDNVLLKYKSENGHLQIQKSRHNIKDTVESTVSKLKYIVAQRKQTLKVFYELSEDYAFYDEVEIERVLTNLIVNAVEYSPENTEIRIMVQNSDSSVSVSVEDAGCGVEEQELDLMLEKYVSKAKNYKKIGTGLGLYICKKIISSHGGSIKVKKLQGTGSRFTFTIAGEKSGSGVRA